jgi:hypothetical protein
LSAWQSPELNQMRFFRYSGTLLKPTRTKVSVQRCAAAEICLVRSCLRVYVFETLIVFCTFCRCRLGDFRCSRPSFLLLDKSVHHSEALASPGPSIFT